MLPALIAQSSDETGSIFIWIVVLLFVLAAGGFAVWLTRKRLSPDEDFRGEGFSLGDLRRLHKEGKLSDEEFERAKATLVEAMHAAQARRDAAQAEAAKGKGLS